MPKNKNNKKEMFSTLRTAVHNIDGDGRVAGHHSPVDEELEKDKSGVIAELETGTDERKFE